jgi:hypothetical protein
MESSNIVVWQGQGNFKVWHARFIARLHTKGLEAALVPEEARTTVAIERAHEKANITARAELTAWLDDIHVERYLEDPDVLHVLADMKATAIKVGELAQSRHLSNLLSLSLKPNESIRDYTLRTRKLVADYRAADGQISDDEILMRYKQGIRGDQWLVAKQLLHQEPVQTLSSVEQFFIAMENVQEGTRINSYSYTNGDHEANAINAKPRARALQVECYNCGEKGHRSKQCPYASAAPRFAAGGRATKSIKYQCENCKRTGHTMERCWAKGGGMEGQGPRARQSNPN